jgi:hypothetical protein
MANKSLESVLQYLHRVARTGHGDDAQLLARFAWHADEVAFERLVMLHGPMVLGLCRRLLRHEQDAEDAFQATFLTLARKADTIARTSRWLAGCARLRSVSPAGFVAVSRSKPTAWRPLTGPQSKAKQTFFRTNWMRKSPLFQSRIAVRFCCVTPGQDERGGCPAPGSSSGPLASKLVRAKEHRLACDGWVARSSKAQLYS